MYRLYKCDADKLKPRTTEYRINKEKPTLIKGYPTQSLSFKKILQNIYWYLLTWGKYRVFCAYDGNKVIHTSYVIPKCLKFPFIKKGEYEIGPCFTNKEYRGKGIYPSVVTKIVAGGGTPYMIVNDNNISSKTSIVKLGFEPLPGEVKISKFKRYIYLEKD